MIRYQAKACDFNNPYQFPVELSLMLVYGMRVKWFLGNKYVKQLYYFFDYDYDL